MERLTRTRNTSSFEFTPTVDMQSALAMEMLDAVSFDVGYDNLLTEILSSYFIGVYTLCRILHKPKISTNPSMNIQTDRPFVVVNYDSSTLSIPMLRAIELGCTVFVVDEDATQIFLDTYIQTHDETIFRRPEKYFLLTIQSTGTVATSHLQMIKHHPTLQEIANLLIAVSNGTSIELLTHHYVGCLPGSTDLLHLDTYQPENRTFLHGNDLFPNKLDDLMGKPMRVATFHLLPWAMMRQTDDGIVRYLNQSYTIDGLDGYILIQFCLWYNCTWELTVDQKNQYGVVFANRTGNGMIGALVERKVDFAIGAVGGWYQLYQYFSFSNPIMWIGVTCLTPRPKLIASWKIIFLMFTKPVWLVLGLTFILLALFEYFLPVQTVILRKKSLSRSFLNLFGAFLLLPSDLRQGRAPEIIFSVSLLIFTFLVGYVYIGKIHSVLAVPVFEPPISSIYDLAMSNKYWNAPHEAWMYALIGSENPYIQKILSKFRATPIEALESIANIGEQAMVLAVLNYGHYMVGTWFTAENIENYRLMSENVYFEYDTAYTSKTWPMMDKFNYIAGLIRDACLYQYVELVDVYRYMNYRVQVSIEHSRDKPHNVLKPFGVDSIEGGLLLLGFGYLTAAAALVYELVSRDLKRKKIARRVAAKWKMLAHKRKNHN
ncbi:uncharacterized protein LOC131680773 [Topomyia yanbarensis]|uniref:uncharacterized protein LOC131680773 n=1 Tax=Topomyia yanbarensis TaxID=2498891 RepID=UPI00273BC601|nr:uncharacterized protein LOC131680773 [Topomyia yanbarensis]